MGEKHNISIIDKRVTIDGRISAKGRLIIRGTVRGTLIGETVVIEKEGAVYADTKVDSITIGGTFEGEIRVSKDLTILSTGRCSGKVACSTIILEPKGVLNAELTCVEGEGPTRQTPDGMGRSSPKA